MLEFFFAKHYLWPKKKQLSVSLIGLMSITLISLVIWLVILFISITEGIEKNWLSKLTSLNAPIRITPTEAYFNSYYYQVDHLSQASSYHTKTIGEKLVSPITDPYDPASDAEIPFYWPSPIKKPNGEVLDFVKETFNTLEALQQKYKTLVVEDYEITGALARFQLIRPEQVGIRSSDTQSFLTQAAYIASFPEKTTPLLQLLKAPTPSDINHLLYLSHLSENLETLKDRPEIMLASEMDQANALRSILQNITIEEVVAKPFLFDLPVEFLPDSSTLTAYVEIYRDQITYLVIPQNPTDLDTENLTKGVLQKKGGRLVFTTSGKSFEIKNLPLLFATPIPFQVKTIKYDKALDVQDVQLVVSTTLQGVALEGTTSFRDLDITKCEAITQFSSEPQTPPPWVYFVKGKPNFTKNGVILPQNFRDYHLLIGDAGYFAYGKASIAAMQEDRMPIKVVGFYDPGVMSVGARVFLAQKDLVHQMSLSSESVALDPMLTNGISVFFHEIEKTPSIALEIKEELKRQHLDTYFTVTPFYEYDFAKDLMSQFQSDRYLFMIVGIIILFVACSNIITLLLLLVNDKKHEIGVIISLGAKKRSIAMIFGLCGVFMGLVSSLIGIGLAYFTLSHIDSLVYLLNILEGKEAFNAAFYGTSLPSTMSGSSIIFVLIAAPILALMAGLIPAAKACRLNPSAILRSE